MAHKNTVEPRFTVGEVIKFIDRGFDDEMEIVVEITSVTTYAGRLAYEVDYLDDQDTLGDAGIYLDSEIQLSKKIPFLMR